MSFYYGISRFTVYYLSAVLALIVAGISASLVLNLGAMMQYLVLDWNAPVYSLMNGPSLFAGGAGFGGIFVFSVFAFLFFLGFSERCYTEAILELKKYRPIQLANIPTRYKQKRGSNG